MINLPFETVSQSQTETEEVATRLALWVENRPPAKIILLSGNLGAGKSVFARALIRKLCHDQLMDVPSPTFTLLQTYETPQNLIYHFDLYRLENKEDIYELGWEDALYDGFSIVEWPERLGSLKPHPALDISITNGDNKDQRIIKIKMDK